MNKEKVKTYFDKIKPSIFNEMKEGLNLDKNQLKELQKKLDWSLTETTYLLSNFSNQYREEEKLKTQQQLKIQN